MVASIGCRRPFDRRREHAQAIEQERLQCVEGNPSPLGDSSRNQLFQVTQHHGSYDRNISSKSRGIMTRSLHVLSDEGAERSGFDPIFDGVNAQAGPIEDRDRTIVRQDRR